MAYFDKTQYQASKTTTTTQTNSQTSSPSLSDSFPSLTQSMSNSSNSPPLPTTPPPRLSQVSSRYSDNLGRVPLHRRGTSQTYERLEDLLREAGYKETRIFTPEGEHEGVTYHEEESPTVPRSSKGSVGAVMDFLTGLLPSTTTQSIMSVATTRPENPEQQNSMDDPTFTTSPLSDTFGSQTLSAQTQRQAYVPGHLMPRTTPSSAEDIQAFSRTQSPIIGTPIPRSPSITRPHSPYYSRCHPHSPQQQAFQRLSPRSGPSQNHHQRGIAHVPLSRQSSLKVVNELPQGQESLGQSTPIAHPRPSRATVYLRRMASRQDVPERPNSTPVRAQPRISLNDYDSDIIGDKGNGEGEDEHRPPPLPRTWLETVARAVLLGGGASYIGGPSREKAGTEGKEDRYMPTKGRAQALRHTRSSLSQVSSRSQPNPKRTRPSGFHHGMRNMLTDQTNKSQSKLSVQSTSSGVSVENLGPPELFLRIGRGRATQSEGQVYPTRVFCRSAPGSRASSVARDRGKEKGFLKVHGRSRRSGGKPEKNRVPSLAKTKAEGDVWTRPKKRKVDVDDATIRPLGGGGGGAAPCYPRHRHHASIRLGEGMRCRYGSDAPVGYGFAYRHVEDARCLGSEEEEDDDDEDYEGPSDDEYDDDDDDDDDELDLAKMLVPPKRQHSIISLRKHLAVTMAASVAASGGAGGPRGGFGGGGGSSRAPASASRLGEGIGVGEFEREIEGGGGASAALSRFAGSASTTMSVMRIRGGYASGSGSGPGPGVAAKRWLQ